MQNASTPASCAAWRCRVAGTPSARARVAGLGVASGMPAKASWLPLLTLRCCPGAHWQAIAFGREEAWDVHRRTAELGGGLRTGLEDTFYLPSGDKATSNGQLIQANSSGRSPKSATYRQHQKLVGRCCAVAASCDVAAHPQPRCSCRRCGPGTTPPVRSRQHRRCSAAWAPIISKPASITLATTPAPSNALDFDLAGRQPPSSTRSARRCTSNNKSKTFAALCSPRI